MPDLLQDYLAEQGFLVLDGALATELERKGANLNDPLWSARCLVESPELIAEVHQDYLQAGADIIASATYQASEKGFMERGLNRREARKLMQGGIRLAVQERDSYWGPEFDGSSRIQKLKPLVAVSMGPFGACLHDGSEYHGNYAASWREVSDFHRERMLWLAEAGADLLAFETIPSQAEAEILLE
ncbi:MAG TPA: homocysteine S-methyltransferase family protein, partial [Xanthomonadales bacterium]|nr:homocysteine S-methyltransferase family protein [Xanthomonadales bacterium]